jgi:hypothetical protein
MLVKRRVSYMSVTMDSLIGWVECESKAETGWNLWWRDRSYTREVHAALGPSQRLNHFQQVTGITLLLLFDIVSCSLVI